MIPTSRTKRLSTLGWIAFVTSSAALILELFCLFWKGKGLEWYYLVFPIMIVLDCIGTMSKNKIVSGFCTLIGLALGVAFIFLIGRNPALYFKP